jgi:flagellar biosynthesis protein FliQ
MTEDFLQGLFSQTMIVALKLSVPLLVAGLGVGLAISILQALTQVQEMTLTFVPKIIVLAAMIVIAGPWMLNAILAFTFEVYSMIPEMTVSLQR